MIKENITIFKRYYYLIKKDKGILFPFYIFVFVNHIIDLLIPVLTAKVVDLVTIGRYSNSSITVLFLLALYLADVVLSYLSSTIYSKFLKHNYINLYQRIVNELYQFDEDYQQKLSNGKIINGVNMDLINISEMADYIYKILMNIIKSIIILFCFSMVDKKITIMIILIDLIYVNLSNTLNQKIAYYFKKQRKNRDKLTSFLQQALNGLRDIKTLNLSKSLNRKFRIIEKRWQRSYQLKRKYVILQKTILKYIIYLGKGVLYIIAISFLYQKKIEIGTMILLVSYYDKFFSSSIQIMESEASIKEKNISLERVYELLEYNKKDDIKPRSRKDNSINGEIEFQKVSFSYGKKNVLKNISFSIKPNRLTVIAGETGSGKTTLFNLLLNLYSPDAGKIMIDKEEIDRWGINENIAVLNQYTFLFNLSIKQNLDLINPDEKRQIEVCKEVGIHDIIMSLERGYQEILKEDGTNLSGGQKRLLSIARMLLTDKKILLFDEATSSLDPKTTDTLIKLLIKLKKNHTIIAISHKKELMKSSDKVILLNHGKVVGEGTHQNLIKTNKYYQQLQNKK